MKPEIIVALVSGAIGLLGGLLGAIVGGGITYFIESKKMSEEGISRPSTLLHEKRVALCEEMIIVADKATTVVWEIWDLSDYQEKRSKQEVQAAIKDINANDILAAEMARISSVYKIYGNAQLIETFDEFVRQYRELMRNPDHTVATIGIDKSMPLVNAIRKEIGTDVLSEHLLDQLHLRGLASPETQETN